MTTDYIKRKDAIAEFTTNGSATVYGIDKCKAIISRLQLIPAADVVPRSIYEQTKWERDFAEKRADDMSKLIRNKDIVGVVRCKDCKHKIEDDYSDGNVPDLICKEWDSGVDAYDYCSYGERAEQC